MVKISDLLSIILAKYTVWTIFRAAERARQAEGLPRERSKARYKKIHTKIPLNTSCSKKIREVFGQKSGRFWPTLLPEIHVVQKNSQTKRMIAERFSGNKVAVFGQHSY